MILPSDHPIDIRVLDEEKVRTIAWVRAMVRTGPLSSERPAHGATLMDAARTCRQPLAAGLIDGIVTSPEGCGGSAAAACATLRPLGRQAAYAPPANGDGACIACAGCFSGFVRADTP